MKDFANFDSKYRFVIVASKRAKELLKGAKSRIKTKSKNPIRIAQNEVKMGLVEYEIIKPKKEEVLEEERVFLSEDVGAEIEKESEEGLEKGRFVEEEAGIGEEAEEEEAELHEESEPPEEEEEEEKEKEED